MKTNLFCFFLLFFAYTNFAQTAVISNKSHQSDLEQLPDAVDHFGAVMEPPVYDTIIKIDAHCVIQIGSRYHETNRFRDTVCNYWYYEQENYAEKKIQEYHGKNTLLIGFEKESINSNGDDRPFGGRQRKQSSTLLFLLLILTSTSVYISLPFLRRNKSNL